MRNGQFESEAEFRRRILTPELRPYGTMTSTVPYQQQRRNK